MLNLVNIRIYEEKYINHSLVYLDLEPIIDSFLVLDFKKDIKNVFEELFESVKYDYCDFPRYFKMLVEIIDVKDKCLPPDQITDFYFEFQVNNYDDIEEFSVLNNYLRRN